MLAGSWRFAFVAGGVMAAGIAQATRRAEPSCSGCSMRTGLGILLSGLCVPFVLEWFGPGSWNTAWALLAAVSLLLAIGLLSSARRRRTVVQTGRQGKPRYRDMRWLLCGYFFFGAGYIAFMTS